MARRSAQDLIDDVLDRGSFESWDSPIDISGHPDPYRSELVAARRKSGVDEAILTGRGTVQGRPVAVIANEFSFLAGSIGCAAADRIIDAAHRATTEGIPLLATTASGGTRMQEGTPAFVKMSEIARAVMAHRVAGFAYLVYLRHPTTGGVFASWGSLGQMTIAEPGALVGFLGPKVYEMLNGKPFPPGIQTAENLREHGMVDAVATPTELPSMVGQALAVLYDPPGAGTRERRPQPTTRSRSSWESITLTRSARRGSVRDVLRHGSDATIRLKGTQKGERDRAMLVALARIDGEPCVVIGQDHTTQTAETPMGPAALREARRGMRLAGELRLPLVSFIDTPGAELSPRAEQGSMAGEIARCLGRMSALPVPSVSVLLGQGAGGGALALLPATTTIAAENAWLSPLPPEGASVILYGHTDAAPELAATQRTSAFDLAELGVVDSLVAEYEGDTAEDFARAVAAEVGASLRRLRGR